MTRGRAPEEYLCDYQGKKQYDRRRMFKRIRKATGVELTPKDLRDYFASVVSDTLAASQILGHTNLRTTTTFYTRIVQERLKNAVSSLDANFGGQRPSAEGKDQALSKDDSDDGSPVTH